MSTFSGTGILSGVYFGASENGEGHWAMCVSWKGEAVFDFIGRSSEGSPLVRSYPYAAEVYDNGQFQGLTPGIDGNIVGGHVTGITDYWHFVGDLDREDSSSAIFAGFWQSRDNRPDTVVDVIVGPSGKALVAAWTPGFVTSGEDGMTRVDASGQFTVTLSRGTRVSGRVDVGARRLLVAFGNDPLPPAPASQGRLGNFSVLSDLNPAGARVIQQFSIVGEQNKNLLLRAVGSPLALLGGAGSYLEDPTLDVWDNDSARIATNDDWDSNDPALLNAMQQVGALPLPTNSRDAARVVALPPGNYTLVTRSSAAGATGAVLAEVFELEANNTRLAQLTSRGRVDKNDALVSGFVVAGDQPALVLVRAIGPKLADFGVADALADPQLKISTSRGVAVAENDNWDLADTALVSAMRRAGGIPLSRPSKDAALLVSLAPGAYVASVRGADGSSGVAQIEITQPSLLRESDVGLAIDSFKVQVTRQNDRYYYEPQVRVFATAAVTPIVVSNVRFSFIDGGGGRIPSWSTTKSVGGGVVDLIDILYGEPEVTFDSSVDASHVAVTITFRDRDRVEHSVTALTQVTLKR